MGDILRRVYNQLAPDPNSLSNLDQDLPNFIQEQVPIYSLPQEWLWCESWCSMETKEKAKTIDLCNNPMHKEPKLDMAKRVISGPLFNQSWISLDEEIHHFEDGVSRGNQRQPMQFLNVCFSKEKKKCFVVEVSEKWWNRVKWCVRCAADRVVQEKSTSWSDVCQTPTKMLL